MKLQFRLSPEHKNSLTCVHFSKTQSLYFCLENGKVYRIEIHAKSRPKQISKSSTFKQFFKNINYKISLCSREYSFQILKMVNY